MFKKTLKTIWYGLARRCCLLFCWVFFRIRASGLENIPRTGPFILASNHQSYLDPVFCGVYIKRQLCFLARKSLFTNPFFGALIRSLGAIPVRRGQADISAIKVVIEELKRGNPVCLYPEGTRTSDGRIAPVKPGLGLLCRRTGAPIVPVVIDGAFECWPRHRKLFRPGKVRVCYGQPISANQAAQLGDRKLAEMLINRLRQMQQQLRARYGKPPLDYSSSSSTAPTPSRNH